MVPVKDIRGWEFSFVDDAAEDVTRSMSKSLAEVSSSADGGLHVNDLERVRRGP